MSVEATIFFSLSLALVLVAIPVVVYRVREGRRERRAAEWRRRRFADYGVSPDGPFNIR